MTGVFVSWKEHGLLHKVQIHLSWLTIDLNYMLTIYIFSYPLIPPQEGKQFYPLPSIKGIALTTYKDTLAIQFDHQVMTGQMMTVTTKHSKKVTPEHWFSGLLLAPEILTHKLS